VLLTHDRTRSHLLKSLLARIGPLDDLENPLWVVRVCPTLAALSLLLAQTLFRAGFLHGVFIGMAVSAFATLSLQMFKARSLELRISAGEEVLIWGIWTLRILPLVCAALIAVSIQYPAGTLHGAALGGCAGLFIAVLGTAYGTETVTPTTPTDPRDLQQLHLPR